jgi:hypothetical protein
VYYNAFRNGTLDIVGTAVQHPTVLNKLGPIRTYRLFFWSTKLWGKWRGQSTFYARVFVSGASANGSVDIWLRKESGGTWRPSRLELLTKGQVFPVPEVEDWYNGLPNNAKNPSPFPRKLPIPVSPGIISTAILIVVMTPCFLLLAAYGLWMSRLLMKTPSSRMRMKKLFVAVPVVVVIAAALCGETFYYVRHTPEYNAAQSVAIAYAERKALSTDPFLSSAHIALRKYRGAYRTCCFVFAPRDRKLPYAILVRYAKTCPLDSLEVGTLERTSDCTSAEDSTKINGAEYVK